MLNRLLQLKRKTSSIFIKLLLGFMAIIVLLVSFNFFSFAFFRNNIRNEIISYNNNNLNTTTKHMEQHLQLVHNVASSLFMNGKLQSLELTPQLDYILAKQVINDLQNTVSNQLLYLDNLFVYSVNRSFVMDKTMGADAKMMFSQYFNNETYTYEFWMEQFKSPQGFQIYPAASFSETTYAISTPKTGLVLPYIVKSSLYPNYVFLGLIDTDKFLNAYHLSINDSLYILDPQGKVLFSHAADTQQIPELPPDRSYIKINNSYYFYTRGAETGLTYINVVPDASISSQIVRLNVTLFGLLAVSVVISIVISVLFTVRFNNPVKKIVESIRHMNANHKTASPIADHANEFEMIRENVGRILQTSEAVHQDLATKNNHLMYYAFINKLKRIPGMFSTEQDLLSGGGTKPFLFVLFRLSFKQRFQEEMKDEEIRSIAFIREFLQFMMSSRLEGSHTFQIESNQILSLVYADKIDAKLTEALEQVKSVMDIDKSYFFLTIAVSPVYYSDTDFTPAYEQTLRRIRHRPFDDETHILLDSYADEQRIDLPSGLEQEFDVHLQAGNEAEAIQTMKRMIAFLSRKKADAERFQRFAEELHVKLDKLLTSLKLGTEEPSAFAYTLLHTIEELSEQLERQIARVCGKVRMKREERDPIISFALEYMENHYTKDVTLDVVAGKLNITPGYLSTYFKEKTGTNFVDAINEIRIKRAAEILTNTDLRIQDVAEQVGYLNMNSFYRMFKKFMGITPTDFRKMRQGES
ncbi:helix-turn-helix domain-containing protein [Paenibacillus koleovorans]|uniref:helix-turn-helix domain-containing protein n=1 Tax=Paenibacillus koleovorans TaxID=121608 RepID=UPI000FD7070F|nr:helix-turn-helix domain-containing protein [Paenibacillus koleovorans]